MNMRKLMDLVESAGPDMVFYHAAARDALASIQAQGLDPNFSKSSLDAIFLSTDPGTAANYMHTHTGEMSGGVILRIDGRLLDERKLGPDNYELQDALDMIDDEDDSLYGAKWSDCDWETSLKLCFQVAYYGVIPPTAIEVDAELTARWGGQI